MTYTVIIPHRFPGMNDFISAQNVSRYKGAEMKREYQKIAQIYIARHLRNLKITERVLLEYHFYEPNRKRDLDNIAGFAHKVIQDALVARGVLENDGWKQIGGFSDTFSVDAKSPRIELAIITE